MSSNNIFDNLEEVNDSLPNINIIRKSKKKLREIARIKEKPVDQRTPEEKKKILEESYWRFLLPPKKKLITRNAYGVTGKIDDTLKVKDDCPICMCGVLDVCAVRMNCRHTFCGMCIESMIRKLDKRQPFRCAMCRTSITTIDFQSEDVMIDVMNTLAFTKTYVVKATPPR